MKWMPNFFAFASFLHSAFLISIADLSCLGGVCAVAAPAPIASAAASAMVLSIIVSSCVRALFVRQTLQCKGAFLTRIAPGARRDEQMFKLGADVWPTECRSTHRHILARHIP